MDRYVTVPEAAAMLNVTRRRVQALIDHGQLRAERAGRQWLVPVSEIEPRKRTSLRRGRPIAASSAWRLLEQGTFPHDAGERDEFRRKVRTRALHVDGFVHPSVLAELRTDPQMVLSGSDAADDHGVPVGAPDDDLHAYLRVTRLRELIDQRVVDTDAATADLHLHAVDDALWPFQPGQRYVSLLVAWLDLADSGDRGERLVQEHLVRALA